MVCHAGIMSDNTMRKNQSFERGSLVPSACAVLLPHEAVCY